MLPCHRAVLSSSLGNPKRASNHTVDGINPAPVEAGSLSHYLQAFIIHPVVIAGFLNHQQYLKVVHQFSPPKLPYPIRSFPSLERWCG